jgi:hypothetical protein
MENREFTVADEYPYNRSGSLRWIASHAMRYPLLPLGTIVLGILSSIVGSQAPLALGRTFDHVLGPTPDVLTLAALSAAVVGLKLGEAALDTVHRVFGEYLSRRPERVLCQPAGQEPDLSRPSAHGRSDGSGDKRRARAQLYV